MDTKKIAHTIHKTLRELGYDAPLGHAYDLLAKIEGYKNWKVASTKISSGESRSSSDQIDFRVDDDSVDLNKYTMKILTNMEVRTFVNVHAESATQAEEFLRDNFDSIILKIPEANWETIGFYEDPLLIECMWDTEKPKKLKGFLLDADEKIVKEISLDNDDKIYSQLCTLLGDNINGEHISGEPFQFDRDNFLLGDSMGLLKPHDNYIKLDSYPGPLSPRLVLIGTNNHTGNYVDCTLSLESVKEKFKFVSKKEASKLAKDYDAEAKKRMKKYEDMGITVISNELGSLFKSDYTVIEVSDDKIFLVDLDKGGRSVTNDAEVVYQEVTQKYGNKRVIYLDSQKEWGEIAMENGRVQFLPYKDYAPEYKKYFVKEHLRKGKSHIKR